MTANFYLFGFSGMSLDEARKLTSSLLGITFEMHESGYLGGDYYLWRDGDRKKVTVQQNFRDEEGYLAEPDFPEFETIAYASYLEPGDILPLTADDRCALLRTTQG